MNVNLELATYPQKSALIHMVSLFLHDLSEFSEYECFNPDTGLFEFHNVDHFWEKEHLKPYFIKNDGQIVGFVLFHYNPARKDYECYINSFFILRKYRNLGIGSEAVKQLFRMYPERYLVTQVIRNTSARKFWHRVYEKNNITFIERERELEGQMFYVQTFTVSEIKDSHS